MQKRHPGRRQPEPLLWITWQGLAEASCWGALMKLAAIIWTRHDAGASFQWEPALLASTFWKCMRSICKEIALCWAYWRLHTHTHRHVYLNMAVKPHSPLNHVVVCVCVLWTCPSLRSHCFLLWDQLRHPCTGPWCKWADRPGPLSDQCTAGGLHHAI